MRCGTYNRKKTHQETQSTESISKQSARLKTVWLDKKSKLATAAQPEDKKCWIHEMDDTCTQLDGLNGGRIGDTARGIGGTGVTAVEREQCQTMLRVRETFFADSRAPQSSTARNPRKIK